MWEKDELNSMRKKAKKSPTEIFILLYVKGQLSPFSHGETSCKETRPRSNS